MAVSFGNGRTETPMRPRVIDLHEADPWSVGAVAVLAVALGVTYWLIDDRRRPH